MHTSLSNRPGVGDDAHGWTMLNAFRQQLATDPSMRWNAIDPSLASVHHAGTSFISLNPPPPPPPPPPPFCTLCRAVDHTCACLFRPPPQATTQAPFQRGPASAWRKPRFSPTCFAWNRGTCPYAGRCNYSHVCSTYSHTTLDCPQATAMPAQPAGPPPPPPPPPPSPRL